MMLRQMRRRNGHALLEGNQMPLTKRSLLLMTCLMGMTQSIAHHAMIEFDREADVEIEGELAGIIWRNPHVRFSVRTVGEDGEPVVWSVEGPGANQLGRIGVDPSMLREGDQIRVAGSPARNGTTRMNVDNVLVDGREYVMGSRGAPRWEDTAVGTDHSLTAGGTVSDDATIFRVWSTDADDPHSSTGGFWNSEYPLTDMARIRQAQWVPITGAECEPKGMPTIMEQPYPIQFVRDGVNILLRMEEYDTVRTIDMTEASAGTMAARSLLGTSRGQWEGSTLVVSTSDIDWEYFDKEGIPQGDSMMVVESFTPSEDGSRLEYSMTVTDPEIFTEPVSLERHWVWRPGEEVKPYDCTSSN